MEILKAILVYYIGSSILAALGILIFWYSLRKNIPSWVKMLKKEKKIFDSILLKNCEKLNSSEKIEIRDLFDEWQRTYSMILSDSAVDVQKRRDELFQKNTKMYLYKPHLFSSNPPSEETSKLFLKDVFTQTHPSDGHDDFGDRFMHIKFAELMILKGVSKNDAKKYYVHRKKLFVNHNMVRGIIQMDIYSLK